MNFTNETLLLKINTFKTFIRFMLQQQQWTELDREDVEHWLGNFRTNTLYEQYLACRLLANIIYFSKKDISFALREGIFNLLVYKQVLETQIASNFGQSLQAINNIFKEEMSKTCFIPLLATGSPHESGNYITRILVQDDIILQEQSNFIDTVIHYHNTKKFMHLVIVDDCIGSGDQFRQFWETAEVTDNDKTISLEKFCVSKNIDISYLTLIGYKNSVEMLRNEYKSIKIYCVRLLTNEQRVFNTNSYVWLDDEEMLRAKKFFKEVTEEQGIDLYGYNNLDFALIMDQTIPDWSLPMFWNETPRWKLLKRRKNSNG